MVFAGELTLARYYDARVGRFISEDSYRGEQTEPQLLNLYSYVRDNPLRFSEPSGHIAIEWGWLVAVDGSLPFGDFIVTAVVIIDGVRYYKKAKKTTKAKSKAVSKTNQKGMVATPCPAPPNPNGNNKNKKENSETNISKKAEEHIIENHGPNSTVPNKSKFNKDFNIIKGIKNALVNKNSKSTPTINGRSIIE